MISVKLNMENYVYDIHSLVKAFYPAQNVTVSAEYKIQKESISFHIEVNYFEDHIEIRFCKVPDEEAQKIKEVEDPSEYVEECKEQIEVDLSDRKDTKNRLKKLLYRMLSERTQKTLPWGTLTGIRPIKLPMKQLESGKSREEIAEWMRKNYLTSKEKIKLSLDIAERELAMLQKLDYRKGYSLYIGIPFCPSTCLYCSFTSYPLGAWRDKVDSYLDALEKEIRFVAEHSKDKVLNTIYIGGGTPTTLEPDQMDRLITMIKENFDLSSLLEFTVEAGRPDSITREKLQVLRKHGISRISINPQTMKQETLKIIGRHHTVEQTIESFGMARELGFDNINMDLIMGLPQEELEDVRATMEILKELDPENITVHSLAIKRTSRLNMERDNYRDIKIINTEEHIDLTAKYCEEMGLSPYYLYRQKNMAGNFENVGYAKPQKAGIYNILIMEEKQTIMALGAGATTKFVLDPKSEKQVIRVENVKDVTNYLKRVDEMIERKWKVMEEIQWH